MGSSSLGGVGGGLDGQSAAMLAELSDSELVIGSLLVEDESERSEEEGSEAGAGAGAGTGKSQRSRAGVDDEIDGLLLGGGDKAVE